MRNDILTLKKGYFRNGVIEVRLLIITNFDQYLSYCIEKYIVNREKNFPNELSWHDLYPDSGEPPYDIKTFNKKDIFLKIGERHFQFDKCIPSYKMIKVLYNSNIFWCYAYYFERS